MLFVYKIRWLAAAFHAVGLRSSAVERPETNLAQLAARLPARARSYRSYREVGPLVSLSSEAANDRLVVILAAERAKPYAIDANSRHALFTRSLFFSLLSSERRQSDR